MIISLRENGKTPMIGGLCFNYKKPYITVYTQLMHHDPHNNAYPIWFFEVDQMASIEIGDYYIVADCSSIRNGLQVCDQENYEFIQEMCEECNGYFRKVISTDYPTLRNKNIKKLDINKINLNIDYEKNKN